jgi:hypothetical protein
MEKNILAANWGKVDLQIAERLAYLKWCRDKLPEEYRKKGETGECFSIRDFYPLSVDSPFIIVRSGNQTAEVEKSYGEQITEKKSRISEANRRLMIKLAHALGEEDKCCRRCLTEVNNCAVFYAQYHPELLTCEAKSLIDTEVREINNKKRLMANLEYSGNSFHLLKLEFPLMGGDTKLHENHLVYFDEFSVRNGKRKFASRLQDRTELLDLANFSDVRTKGLQGISRRFFSSSSEIYIPFDRGHRKTIVEIISRNV